MAAAITTFVAGVDIGASMSRITQLEVSKKMPIVQRNSLSNEATPSCISFPPGEMRLAGESAAPKELSKPDCTVGSITDLIQGDGAAAKRLNRRGAGALADTFAPGSQPEISMGEAGDIPATRLISFFFDQLLGFGTTPGGSTGAERLVIACPVGFTQEARNALLSAAMLSGRAPESVSIVEDTTAAAAYFHHLQYDNLPKEDSEEMQHCVIINIGHGSSSAVYVKAKQMLCEVVAEASIPFGSRDIDDAIAQHIFKHIEQKHKFDVSTHAKSHNKVLRDSKKAKEMLSTSDSTQISLECLANDIDVNTSVKRGEVEQLISPIVQAVEKMLCDLGVADDVKANLRVEAIGGGWRFPPLQAAIKRALGCTRIGVGLDANLAIAEGCAVLGAAQYAANVPAKPEGEESKEGEPVAPHPLHRFKLDRRLATQSPVAPSPEILSKWLEDEAKLKAVDSTFKARLSEKDKLESYILRTRENLQEVKALSDSERNAIMQQLDDAEQWLWDDCEDANADAIRERCAALISEVDSNEHLKAFYEEQKEIQRKKDEELERLSKLQDEDKELKSDPQRLRGAQQRREQGVTLFKQEHYQEAQTRFVQALGILGQLYDTSAEETVQKKNEISLSCHLNIASCSFKLAMWKNCINNATKALDIDPGNAKAYFRRGQAKVRCHDHQSAMEDLEKAKELTNGDAGVVAEIEALKVAMEAEKAKQKKMFSKMFS